MYSVISSDRLSSGLIATVMHQLVFQYPRSSPWSIIVAVPLATHGRPHTKTASEAIDSAQSNTGCLDQNDAKLPFLAASPTLHDIETDLPTLYRYPVGQSRTPLSLC